MNIKTELNRLKTYLNNRSVFKKKEEPDLKKAFMTLLELSLEQRDEIETLQRKVFQLEKKSDYGARMRDVETQIRDIYKRLQK